MKLTLDNKAITALIESDPQFIIDLKTAIIESAIRKHIKSIDGGVQKEIQIEINKVTHTFDYYGREWKPSNDFKKRISNMLAPEVDAQLKAIIEERVNNSYGQVYKSLNDAVSQLDKQFEEKVHAYEDKWSQFIQTNIDTYMTKALNDKINKEVNRRLELLQQNIMNSTKGEISGGK